MSKGSGRMARPKRPRDLNLLASQLVKELTHDPDEGKDAKAVPAGRLGGKKGGPCGRGEQRPLR